MKITIIPDIHGHSFWKQAKKSRSDVIISLGDLVDDWDVTDDAMMKNLDEFLEWAEKNDVVRLWGNHDMQYIGGTGCSGRRYNLIDKIAKRFKEQTKFKIAHQINNWLFTHAGLSPVAYEKYYKPYHEGIGGNYADLLNELFKRGNPDVYAPVGIMRGGRDDAGSVVWADISETKDSPMDVNQVMGHNRVPDILDITYPSGVRHIYCDRKSTKVFELEI